MPIKSLMSSNMGQIESEHPELFALEFGKIAEPDFLYTLASRWVRVRLWYLHFPKFYRRRKKTVSFHY